MDHWLRPWLFDPIVGRLIVSALALLAVYVAAGLVRRVLGRYMSGPDAQYRARKFVAVLGWVVAIGLLGVIYSDRLGGLTVAFGVAGAGVAFALQEVIASVAGWLTVVVGGFYRVGDRIQLAGIRGDVIDVGILRTTLMECGDWVDGDLYNGRIVRVANSFVFKQPVFNYSGDFPFLWDEIRIPIKYGSDYHVARRLIEEVGQEVTRGQVEEYGQAWSVIRGKYRLAPQPLESMVSMVANENWIEFKLRYIVDYRERRTTRDRLFQRILEQVDTAGDRVGIAAATLNVEKLVVSQIPPVEVRIADDEGTPRAARPDGGRA